MDKTKILLCRPKPVQSGKPSASGRVKSVVKGLAETPFIALSGESGYVKDVEE